MRYMAYVAKKPQLMAGIAGLCALIATAGDSAAAATFHSPAPSAASRNPAIGPARPLWPSPASSGAAPRAPRTHAAAPRLNLTVPLVGSPASDPLSATASPSEPRFGAGRRPTVEIKNPDYREQLPALGPDARPQTMSTAEAWARRWHHEGLPVARLWQNRSALLSLGLSPRGKPGLWLIQKTQ